MDTLDQIEQENIEVPYLSTCIQWGAIGGLFSIIFTVGLYILDLQYVSGIQAISLVVMFICTFFGVKAVRSAHPTGLISFGSAFKVGFLTCIIISAISMLFYMLYINVIDSSYLEHAQLIAREKMQEKGLSEIQINYAMKMQSKFMTKGFTMIFGGISNLLLSVLFALISAGILKKRLHE